MRGDLLLLLADAIAILCITRFLLRYAGLAAEHPLLKFSIQATGWLTKPWQKAFPSGEKTDWYCLPAGFLVYYLACTAIIFISPALSISNKLILANFWFAALHMLKAAAYTLLIGLIIRMVSSIQSHYSPLTYAIERILQPLLKPFSFLRVGRYDFSGSLLALLIMVVAGPMVSPTYPANQPMVASIGRLKAQQVLTTKNTTS
ncbi:hypothetical protein NEIFL0001_2415 [Neisseria flavescens SK114]|nr:hypothetical protein NEIFL0001_2415 [Neisseria flavescens SK114]